MRCGVMFVILISLLCPLTFAATPQTDLEARRKALNDLLAENWEYRLRTSPVFASILGDKRWNDKLDDFSQKAIDDDLEQDTPKFLARFEAIDTAGFPEQEALNKTLMVRDLKMTSGRSSLQTLGNAGHPIQRCAYQSDAPVGERPFVSRP